MKTNNGYRMLIALLLSCVIAGHGSAQENKGIRFETGSFAQTLQKAKASGKYVFIDAYAVWCGPCKWMDQNVYPTKAAGDYFNAHFISAKFDMEKGEGRELAKRYGVHAFPTFLFVDGKGKLVHRFTGGMDAQSFIAAANDALSPATQYVTKLELYQKGKRDMEFICDLAYSARTAGEDSIANVLKNAYLAKQTDSLADKNAKMLFDFNSNAESSDFRYILRHARVFRSVVGVERYGQKMGELAYSYAFQQAGIGKGLSKDNACAAVVAGKAYLEQTVPDQSEKLLHRLSVNIYGNAGDMDGYAAEMQHWYSQYPSSNPDELNALALNFCQNISNPKYLKIGLDWVLQSISMGESYTNLGAAASLYSKLGDKVNARIFAEKAITLGKAQGLETSGTEKLLAALIH